MNKVALNFICKNESHIIERMLQSAKPIADMIVAVDTGSADDTVQRILAFGQKVGLPTFVFSRPFDNFCNSRNYALTQLKVMAKDAGWDLSQSWGFTIDCDEWVKFATNFRKGDLSADFYVVKQRIGRETFTRHGLYRLSKDIVWESPVHETLVYSDPSIVKAYALDIEIVEEPLGASWRGDLEAKFLRYAEVLKAYLNEGHNNFRTIFFIGDSYNAAGSHSKDPIRAKQYFELADQYLKLAAGVEAGGREVRFMLFKKMAENSRALGCQWPRVMEYYLTAFLEYPAKAETFAQIIEHYIDEKKWELAYWYSHFSYTHFSLNQHQSNRILYNDESLYQWRLLFCCYYTAFQSGRQEIAKKCFKEITDLQKNHPEWFTEEDLILIQIHSPMVLKMNRWRQKTRKLIAGVLSGRNKTEYSHLFPTTPKKIHYAV